MDEETASMARLEAAISVTGKEIAAKADVEDKISALIAEHGFDLRKWKNRD